MDFNFAYFEIEESLGLVWVKLQKGRFHLQSSSSGIQKVLVSGMGFIFAHFVYKESCRQIWIKIVERSLDLKISILVLVSQVLAFHFVHFGYKKDFWQILIKFIVYRVSLSPSRFHKKPFQLVDLVIGRL